MGPQQLDVPRADRLGPRDRPGDSRHGVRLAGAVHGGAVPLGVDAAEGGGEAVGVAFSPDFPVGDDVHAGALHLADSHHGGVVLGLGEAFRRDLPEFPRPHPRRQACAERRPIDQPVRLRVAPHHSGRHKHAAEPNPPPHPHLFAKPPRQARQRNSGSRSEPFQGQPCRSLLAPRTALATDRLNAAQLGWLSRTPESTGSRPKRDLPRGRRDAPQTRGRLRPPRGRRAT